MIANFSYVYISAFVLSQWSCYDQQLLYHRTINYVIATRKTIRSDCVEEKTTIRISSRKQCEQAEV